MRICFRFSNTTFQSFPVFPLVGDLPNNYRDSYFAGLFVSMHFLQLIRSLALFRFIDSSPLASQLFLDNPFWPSQSRDREAQLAPGDSVHFQLGFRLPLNRTHQITPRDYERIGIQTHDHWRLDHHLHYSRHSTHQYHHAPCLGVGWNHASIKKDLCAGELGALCRGFLPGHFGGVDFAPVHPLFQIGQNPDSVRNQAHETFGNRSNSACSPSKTLVDAGSQLFLDNPFWPKQSRNVIETGCTLRRRFTGGVLVCLKPQP
jgi:hypothetical protein